MTTTLYLYAMIGLFVTFMYFLCGINALKLQLGGLSPELAHVDQCAEALEKLEGQYNQIIKDRLSSGIYNMKATPNVILFLVEGLDSHTMSAARKIMSDTTPNNAMHVLDSFITGFIKPHSRDHMVADPAAASSSIFTGLPERNGQMGWVQQDNNTCLERDQNKKLANLFKMMSMAGKRTALVATAPMTSPGVAGTYASAPDMKLESDIHVNEAGCNGFVDIAKQLIVDNNHLNVIVGSGRNYFHLKYSPDELTGGTLPDARSDLDLKKTWVWSKLVKQRPHKISIGKAEVSAALANDTLDYILGFLEEKDDLELTSQNLKDLVNNFRKKSSNSSGYFITVYIDQIARAHDASKGVKAVHHLNTILGLVNDIYCLVKGEDTLLLLASTQGSTLTVGSGAYLNEKLDGFANTEACAPYTFLNYAFGLEKSSTYGPATGGLEYKFPSLYYAQGTTGGPDLPVFASGKSAGIFTGVNTFPYLHHAILCATCLAKNATALYRHCLPQSTTTTMRPTTSTTTSPTPTTTATARNTVLPPKTPVTPPKTTVPLPKPNFWSRYIQPYPGKGPNPYANMVSSHGMASPASGMPRPPQPSPTQSPAQNSNSQWNWQSLLPFLLN